MAAGRMLARLAYRASHHALRAGSRKVSPGGVASWAPAALKHRQPPCSEALSSAPVTMVVAAKWTGTNADRQDMEKMQLDQVLRVGQRP